MKENEHAKYASFITLKLVFLFFAFIFTNQISIAQIRQDILLDENWKTVADDQNQNAYPNFEYASFTDKNWKKVDVPHNWDDYGGYRRLRNGNRFGYAWYRKTFSIKNKEQGKRYFLWFEGVGSYATVWLNGKKIGYHAGGRTSFTIDISDVIKLNNQPNMLAVRADHPDKIQDLPWVSGGSSEERGFSEGSQPMGIFRPVHLIVTNPIRVEPFGVHIWNDSTISTKSAILKLETEIKNYGKASRKITVVNKLIDQEGKTITEISVIKEALSGKIITIPQQFSAISNPHLWSMEDPYLYQLITEISENGKVIDQLKTPCGIRWISWPIGRKDADKRFFLNGKPVFINGIAEYEHLIGQSHAFSAEQIRSRAMQIKTAGFNAFRDAHQPHNLRYQDYWDEMGLLWWPQLSAHVWFDTPEFRKNFKQLLVDWVKERRNSPSIVLWGLQNESKLPKDFAQECSDLIRKFDPTASSQRKITTCNGGEGTDWDVPQNWTGTYGGDPKTYGEDVKRQNLIGEYGAWRTLDLHSEGPFQQNGILSEDRMTQLMEQKIRLAESVKDSSSGQFFWLFNSHDNPGRVQGGEGYREMDRVGPVNYKGLLTPWEEPLDVFYMFRANYAPKKTEPMVYIVSHTWPDRWLKPGKKDSIIVYSNCDEVELFNDVNSISLGRKKRGGIGTHFQWDGVNINYNVLYAVGYVDGKAVAKDIIKLNHLPEAPHLDASFTGEKSLLKPEKGYKYLYRVNCGGPDYTDKNSNVWMADRQISSNKTYGSTSWTADYPGMPAYFASQRRTFDPIKGTVDEKLFQTFRYGREKLQYKFPVPDGDYLVELYFIEPWLGTGGGMDCTAWRLFDVAVNDQTLIKNLDIWKEVGHDQALKKTVKAHITGGKLVISFPKVLSGQAVISAIAIASANQKIVPAPASPALIQNLAVKTASVQSWMDTGEKQFSDDEITFSALPSELYGADWIRFSKANQNQNSVQFKVIKDADVFVGINTKITQKPNWLQGFEDTKTTMESDTAGGTKFTIYKKRYVKEATVIVGESGNNLNDFVIAVNPATTIEPAYDLKLVITYKAPAATLTAGLAKETINEKAAVTFKKANGDVLEWNIAIGAADTYSLTIKYANTQQKTLKAKLELRSADGTLMKQEMAEFTNSKPGKWNYFTSSTGTMINAGNYKISLIALDAEGLSISGLDVQ